MNSDVLDPTIRLDKEMASHRVKATGSRSLLDFNTQLTAQEMSKCCSGLTPDPCKILNDGPCNLCLELEALEEESQALLDKLAEPRAIIKAKVNKHHDPFILRLPIEIASQIFIFCLSGKEFMECQRPSDLLYNSPTRRIPFNIALGSICRGWRNIAWSTPQLWSTLFVRFHASQHPTQVELMHEWLIRSRQVPLDVVIWWNDERVAIPIKNGPLLLWKPLLDVVNRCSSRWRALWLSIPSTYVPYITGDGRGHSVLQDIKFWSQDMVYDHFSLQNGKPTPRRISIRNMFFKLIDIDWSGLTHAIVTGFCLNESLALLQHAPRMSDCDISSLIQGSEEQLPSPTHVIHFALKRLVAGSGSVTTELLDCITLPSLRELELTGMPSPSAQQISALIQRSSCKLIKFVIGMDCSTNSMGILPLLHDLEDLNSSEDFPKELLKELAATAVMQNDKFDIAFLPNLRSLYLNPVASFDCSTLPRIFAPVVEIQGTRRRPLKTLNVKVFNGKKHYKIDMKTAYLLQGLIEGGLDVTMKTAFGGGELNLISWSLEQ